MRTAEQRSEPVSQPAAWRRILYVCNDADYFSAHRAHLARRLNAEGWDVHVACGGDLSALGAEFTIHPLDVERRHFSPRRDLTLVGRLRSLIRALKPEVVHLITMKPIVFAAAAALLVGRRSRVSTRFVATFPGLGRVFEDRGAYARAQRAVVGSFLKLLFSKPGAHATFENRADRDRLVSAGILQAGQAVVLPGAGLDLSRFSRRGGSPDRFSVLWASRLVRGKGLTQFAEAARMAHANGDAIDFIACGQADPGHADNLPQAEIEAIASHLSLRFLGHVKDMPDLLASVDAICLPSSYREGLPRLLIEAAASSLPMIASDVPGCREIVEDGVNGIILPDTSALSIYRAVRRLAGDRAEARRMGEEARVTVHRNGYDERLIQDRTIELYNKDALSWG